MRWSFLLALAASARAAVIVPLRYNTKFLLPDLPFLQQAKFLDLSDLLHSKRQLRLDLGGLLHELQPLVAPLVFVFDAAWQIETLAASATQGSANAWYSQIQVGTPPQTLQLVFDSGSTDLILYDPSCVYCTLANGRTAFQWQRSKTFKRSSSTFQAQYGSSGFSVQGYGAKDVISLPSANVPGQMLAMITNTSSYGGFSNDGLIGLAQAPLAAIKGTRTIFDSLVSASKLEAPLVGIALRQSLSGDGGEYSFGQINRQYARGALTYLPVTSSLYWGTSLGDIEVIGRSVLPADDPRRVIFDTGTTLALVSDSVALNINKQVPGSFYDAPTGRWYVPCIGSPFSVDIVLGGQVWSIPGRDMAYKTTTKSRCLSSFQGGMQNFFVLGDVFIKNHYLVLHQGDASKPGKHVGLAKRADV